MKLVALVLLQFSFLAGASALAAGATCADTAACADPNLLCESGVCKIKVDATTCTATTDANCVANAACIVAGNGFKCSCTGSYASDGGFCRIATGGTCTSGQANQCKTTDVCEGTTCKRLIGQACTATECVTGASCTSSVCTCPTGKTASTDKKTCSGAASVIASLALLLASVVTSRYM